MPSVLDNPHLDLRQEPHSAWRLLLTVHAMLTREVDQALRAAGQLSFEAYDVLITLQEAPGGKMRMSDLAGATLLISATFPFRPKRCRSRGACKSPLN